MSRLAASLSPSDANYAIDMVDRLLAESVELGASDLHLQPTAEGLWVRWRIDGVLQSAGTMPAEVMPNIVSRLKVLAGLLTYQTDRPQEGRIRDTTRQLDVRVSTFPTLHGEKAVVRFLSTGETSLQTVAQLGFPTRVETVLRKALSATQGAIVLVGPAGSGKTTTAYSCVRDIVAETGGGRSVASLEDPIEAVVEGVAQSQMNDAVGFDLAAGLRSLVRQDPEVILVGEIRDAATASTAYQAAMTGQLVVTTFHAGSTVEAITRLLDMGIPPYVVRGATRVIVAQRLLRRLCECAEEASQSDTTLPFPTAGMPWDPTRCRVPVGCDACRQTGYRGRVAAAEILTLDDALFAEAVLDRTNAFRFSELADSAGMISVATEGVRLVERGVTSAAEWVRVFGFDEIEERLG